MNEYSIEYYESWNNIRTVRLFARTRLDAIRKLRSQTKVVEIICCREI